MVHAAGSTGQESWGTWDIDPFDGLDLSPAAEIVVYRKAPKALAGDLVMPPWQGTGVHPLRILGNAWGDAKVIVSIRDRRPGHGRRTPFCGGGEVILRGFGEPRMVPLMPTPAADLESPRPPAPQGQTKGATMPHEVYGAPPRTKDDPVLAHVLSQTESAEARADRAEQRAAEYAARIEEMQRKHERDAQLSVLNDILAELKQVRAENAQLRNQNGQALQELAELKKGREGLTMHSIEEWCERTGKLQELGVQLPGISEKAAKHEGGMPAWVEMVLEQVIEKFGPTLAELVMSKLMARSSAAASAPTPPEATAGARPPGVRPRITRRRVGSVWNAGPGRADTGT